jgi:hypothetical protein
MERRVTPLSYMVGAVAGSAIGAISGAVGAHLAYDTKVVPVVRENINGGELPR